MFIRTDSLDKNDVQSKNSQSENLSDHLRNIMVAVGCDQKEFLEIVAGYKSDISMSSGSYYADFWIFGRSQLLAIYGCKGNLKYRAQAVSEEF